MRKLVCDNCGKTVDHADRLDYQLDYRGSLWGWVKDFCSLACVRAWTLKELERTVIKPGGDR